ncbi:hypothetical protein [Halomonas heilongjiangensis]|uniref:hypothetical protein n=1 Tax=Halomonas heilongjiangensis TaxID=1387883 RepID=UPI0011AFBDA3|nr:hypothetical protein [Halomonas heilongjiangensis]
MANETKFTCSACDKAEWHDPSKGHIPFGWCNRDIEGTIYLLCNSCGIEGRNAPDISPILCEIFASKGVFFEGCKKWEHRT